MKYIRLIVAGLLLVSGCTEDSTRLDARPADGGPADAGPVLLEYCDNGSVRLNADGQFESVPVRCPRGAVCGTSGGYLACYTDGSQLILSGEPVKETVERLQAHNPDYPHCTRNDQCDPHGGGLCFYQPGCVQPSGICCPGNACGGTPGGFEPARWDCSEGRCLTYCGCDGVTYNDLPTEPYAYPGPCR